MQCLDLATSFIRALSLPARGGAPTNGGAFPLSLISLLRNATASSKNSQVDIRHVSYRHLDDLVRLTNGASHIGAFPAVTGETTGKTFGSRAELA